MTTDARTWPLPFSDLAQLELVTPFGDIALVALAPGEAPHVEQTGGDRGLKVETAKDGDVVRIRLTSAEISFLDFGAPHARLVLHVPPNVRARVRTEFGRIRAERLDQGCDLDLATTAGAMQLEQITGRMALRTGAGQISGEKLAGTFDVVTAAGSVRLAISGLQPGHHRISTSMGAVRVDLSPGIQVKLETRTSMGSIRRKYPSSADAPAVLEVSTELGSVKVREAGQADERHGDFPRWDVFPGWKAEKWADAWGRFWTAQAPASDAPPPPRRPIRDEELSRILSLVEQGKISAQEAERLIRAIEDR